jgi:hypothetical protein
MKYKPNVTNKGNCVQVKTREKAHKGKMLTSLSHKGKSLIWTFGL